MLCKKFYSRRIANGHLINRQINPNLKCAWLDLYCIFLITQQLWTYKRSPSCKTTSKTLKVVVCAERT
ncbi:hypothetical protein NQ317_009945 [Molorchus minor]|uniref:Uncharacterized protein n=1 Tax=Molorchus minor TaxID=1323400 RepID=A0ABQ9K7F2_9CUCU|nr:hypothetical protein NQ317_009945 [Molorchus minor]